jgi:heme o synthase
MLDYWNLTRPKIVVMVLAAMLVSGWTAAGAAEAASRTVSAGQWIELLHSLLGTTGVIVGAIALNQRLERHGDAVMPRTADRPLPSGRLTDAEVTRFGAIATLAGAAYLIFFCSAVLVILAVAGWVIYVCVYTPLKRRSIWQTPVGAAAGAMPALLGAAAVGKPLSPFGWSLFAVVFCWQLPHSMAIAWLYRRQLADADIRVATVVDGSGRTAGASAAIGAILLLPASLAPVLFLPTGWVYGVVAAFLGSGYLFFSLVFLLRRDEISARRLLWASLVYLPLVLTLLVLSTCRVV